MTLNVNGHSLTAQAPEETTLLAFLRDFLHLTGAKYGCGEGACGACTVLVDGREVRACLVKAASVAGKQVTTIEGLAIDGQLHPVQQAFLDVEAFQCGFCTPGMIVASAALLKDFDVWTPGEEAAHDQLDDFADRVGPYDHDRNLPSIDGSSRLSPHLHFGEISAAAVWHRLHRHKQAQVYLREIGWRDFGVNLIDQFAAYGRRNGRPAMNDLPWRSGAVADADFDAWTKGRTGYPIVDAGMRQLWTTGWMHNRVRMIAASFLIKHLLIDWRRGERWFWDTLVDADYGNNSMNWQWVAGTGVDSSPFGRIMAPLTQSPKFEAAGYIRAWVPELAHLSDDAIHDPHGSGVKVDYPEPLIGHREGRERALAALAKVRS